MKFRVPSDHRWLALFSLFSLFSLFAVFTGEWMWLTSLTFLTFLLYLAPARGGQPAHQGTVVTAGLPFDRRWFAVGSVFSLFSLIAVFTGEWVWLTYLTFLLYLMYLVPIRDRHSASLPLSGLVAK
jgi:hypothetical protein